MIFRYALHASYFDLEWLLWVHLFLYHLYLGFTCLCRFLCITCTYLFLYSFYLFHKSHHVSSFPRTVFQVWLFLVLYHFMYLDTVRHFPRHMLSCASSTARTYVSFSYLILLLYTVLYFSINHTISYFMLRVLIYILIVRTSYCIP